MVHANGKESGMSASFPPPAPPAAPVLARVRALRVRLPHISLFDGLSFDITPGLTLVRGGDGRGKTTLLRLLAGGQVPDEGQVERFADGVFWVDPRDGDGDGDRQTVRQWLQARRQRHPAWDDRTVDGLLEAFTLGEHLDKGLYMLSTGTRRKMALAAAMASGAPLTLLDTPFAALDGRSRGIVGELLDEAAGHPRRAFVVADHELPPGMPARRLAGMLDLGD